MSQELTKCKGVPNVCMESDNITTGQPFTISWPSGFFSTPSASVLIHLYQGNVFTSDPCAPKTDGRDLPPVESWNVASNHPVENNIAYYSISVNDATIQALPNKSSPYFFQVTTSDKRACMVGPLENTNWTINSRLTASTAATKTPPPVANPSTDNNSSNSSSSNPNGSSSSSSTTPSMSSGVLVGIIIGSVAVAALVVVAFAVSMKRRTRHRSGMKKMSDLEKNQPTSANLIENSTNTVNNLEEAESTTPSVNEVLKTPKTPVIPPIDVAVVSPILLNKRSSSSFIQQNMSDHERASTSSGLLIDDAKLIADTFRKELGDMEWDDQRSDMTGTPPGRSPTAKTNDSDEAGIMMRTQSDIALSHMNGNEAEDAK